MRVIVFFTICLLLFAAPAFAHYEGELLPDSVAVMEYQMIISMTPKDTLTRNKLGMVYLRQNKLGKAREQFLEILKLDPANFDALDSLGLVSDREGNYLEAVGWYGRALKVKAGDAGVRKRYETALGRTKANETGNAKKEEVRH
jgi:tetratricopeptide (TPR) repeat protein